MTRHVRLVVSRVDVGRMDPPIGSVVTAQFSSRALLASARDWAGSGQLVSRPVWPPRTPLLGWLPLDPACRLSRASGNRSPRRRFAGADRQPVRQEGPAAGAQSRYRCRCSGRRRIALHRAGVGRQPEGQAHRGKRRIRHLQPAWPADRRGPRSRPKHHEETRSRPDPAHAEQKDYRSST